MVAGVAVASASVLAITPTLATPTMPEVRVAPVDLSAFQNPLEVWGDVFTGPAGLLYQLEQLNSGVTSASGKLTAALGDPAVQAQFTDVFANLTDPQRIQSTLAALPGFGDRLSTAGDGLAVQLQEALTALPGVLELSAGLLAQGKFLEAFGEVNLWFLTAGLSDFRGSLLDAFRVPGDFLDSVGLEPLARILGTTWMDQYYDPDVIAGKLAPGEGRTGYGPGLLSRGVIGNFGRALLAPQVTAIFQTVEIMDRVGTALQASEFETAASELINAPAKITNAFLNGYVPAFVGDPDGPFPPGPGQSFPGVFSETGPVDFFFRQVPEQIATSLRLERPAAPAPVTGLDSDAVATLVSATDANVKHDAVTVTLETGPSEHVTTHVPAPHATLADSPRASAEVSSPDVQHQAGEADSAVGVAGAEGTADEAGTPASAPKPRTGKERTALTRERIAEHRQVPASTARTTVDRVRSNVRKSLGVSDRSENTASNSDGGQTSSRADSGSKTKSEPKPKTKRESKRQSKDKSSD